MKDQRTTSAALGFLGGVVAAGAIALLVRSPDAARDAHPRAVETGSRPSSAGLLHEDAQRTLREAREQADAAAALAAKLRSENESLRVRIAQETEEAEKLRSLVASLGSEAQAAREGAGGAHSKADGSKKGGLKLGFGRMGELEALKKANWGECGEALRGMIPLLKDLTAKLKAGEQVPNDLMLKVSEQNMKLVKLAMGLADALPTEAGINGSYTHPIVLANLMASQLDASGQPFSDSQIDDLNRLGEAFNQDWQAKRDGYTSTTLKLEKLADELELKHAFVEKMFAVLTTEQAALVLDPTTHDRAQLDLYSPLLMLAQFARVVAKPTQDALKGTLLDLWLSDWEIDPARRQTLDPIAAAWVADNTPRLTPVALKDAALYSFDDADLALRSIVKAEKEVLRTLAPDDDTAKAIRDGAVCPIPRIVAAPAK